MNSEEQTSITLGGDIRSALWHFCGYGLAAILTDAGVSNVRLRWEATPERTGFVISGATATDVGRLVQLHALAATSSSHWLQARVEDGPRKGTGLMSPRTKPAAGRQEWHEYLKQRNVVMDGLPTKLDRDMIAGLGIPAHWRHTEAEVQPDSGASRWEMKTRNRGEEFVRHRLAPLAEVVAGREPSAILSGLVGRTLVDETATEKLRTPTGFSVPRKTDSAVAWATLWGMSWFPVRHATSSVSATPGAYPRGIVHPTSMTLPIIEADTSPARWRAIIRSCALGEVASRSISEAATGVTQLRQWGVSGVVRFTVQTGSAKAPERMVLEGDPNLFG